MTNIIALNIATENIINFCDITIGLFLSKAMELALLTPDTVEESKNLDIKVAAINSGTSKVDALKCEILKNSKRAYYIDDYVNTIVLQLPMFHPKIKAVLEEAKNEFYILNLCYTRIYKQILCIYNSVGISCNINYNNIDLEYDLNAINDEIDYAFIF